MKESLGSGRLRDAACNHREHLEIVVVADAADIFQERHVLLDQLPTADVDQLPVPVFFKKPQPELVEGAA